MKKKEIPWFKRAVSFLHHKSEEQRRLVWIWRAYWPTRLKDPAVRNFLVFMAHLVVASLWAWPLPSGCLPANYWLYIQVLIPSNCRDASAQ
eukprot:1161944-Pelagomonas_calceolata.AAC.21